MKRHVLNIVALVCLLIGVFGTLRMTYDGPLAGTGVFIPSTSPRQYTEADLNAFVPPPPAFKFAGLLIERSISVDYHWTDGTLIMVPWWLLTLGSLLIAAKCVQSRIRMPAAPASRPLASA